MLLARSLGQDYVPIATSCYWQYEAIALLSFVKDKHDIDFLWYPLVDLIATDSEVC